VLHVAFIGRSPCLKLVLECQPVYLMSLEIIPYTSLNNLRKIMFNFVWKRNNETEHYHLCKWELLTLPKKYGGWGLRNLFDFNKDLAENSLWRVLMCDGIWNTVIIDKYLPHTTVKNWLRSPSFLHKSASGFWRGLLKLIHLITHCLTWSLGSGHLIALGRDMILGMGDKSFLSSPLLSDLKNRNITSLLQARRIMDNHSTSFWYSSSDLGLSGALGYEWNCFRTALIDLSAFIQDIADEILCTGGDNSGIITVKNTYLDLLSTQGLKKVLGWRQSLWKWDLQLRIKCLILLAAEKKILTWENLIIRGWEGPSCCYLRLQEVESTNHLFIHCAFAKTVWEILAMIMKYKNCWKGNNLIECLNCWVDDKSVPTLVASHTCWFIWLERNTTIFEEKYPSIHRMISKTLGFHKSGLKS